MARLCRLQNEASITLESQKTITEVLSFKGQDVPKVIPEAQVIKILNLL